MGGWQFFLLGARIRHHLLPVGRDLVPLSLQLCELITIEQEAVPSCAREDLVLQVEVSHHDHGERLPTVKIKEWHLVIAQHGNLRELSLVLGAPGNYQAAPIIFLPVGLS